MSRLALVALLFLGAVISSIRSTQADLTLPFTNQARYDDLVNRSWLDHTSPLFTDDTNPTMTRYDGKTGYSYNGHSGIDYPLSFEPVLAAAQGQVVEAQFNDCKGNYVRIYHAALGYSTEYAHLDYDTVSVSQVVQRGQQIAVSGFTGDQPDCIDGPHLHFTGKNGQSGSESIDPYGWSGTGSDPWTTGQNFGHLFAIRVGVLKGNANPQLIQLSEKDGTLGAGWTTKFGTAIVESGARSGTISGGKAWVRDGQLDEIWYQQANAKAVALSGRRIGIIDNFDDAFIKNGDLFQGWSACNVSGADVSQIAVEHNVTDLTPDRTAVLPTSVMAVKEGSGCSTPTSIATNCATISLGAGWMGCLTTSGYACVKDTIAAGWNCVADGVTHMSIGGDGADRRIGVVKSDGSAWAKVTIGGAWVHLTNSIVRVKVNSGRIGLLTSAGQVWVDEGELTAPDLHFYQQTFPPSTYWDLSLN